MSDGNTSQGVFKGHKWKKKKKDNICAVMCKLGGSEEVKAVF